MELQRPIIVTQYGTYYLWSRNARASLWQGDVDEIQLRKNHQKFQMFSNVVGDKNAKAVKDLDALEIRGSFIVTVMEINSAGVGMHVEISGGIIKNQGNMKIIKEIK